MVGVLCVRPLDHHHREFGVCLFLGLFTLMPFSTLPIFGKVYKKKKVATFILLPNFSNYIRNSTKILVNFGKFW
jgi:hypothetical protein